MAYREKCKVCNCYLIAIDNKHWMHPEVPCSGVTDAIRVQVDVEDEMLQNVFDDMYGTPELSDHELLNRIWNSRLLRWLIEHWLLKQKG